MKVKLPKNRKDPHIYWPAALFLAFIVGVLIVHLIEDVSLSSILVLFAAWLPLLITTFSAYQITDNNQLVGNGVITISLIQRVERKPKGGLRIFYVRMEGGEIRSRSYYPVDEQHFIDNLLEINPNIKLN